MPPITGQTINSDGFTINTTKYGTFQVVITRVGAQTTVTVTQNGSILTNPTITNATPAVVETLINNAINGVLLGAGGGQNLYIATHIASLSPLSLTMISANNPIGPEWWLAG